MRSTCLLLFSCLLTNYLFGQIIRADTLVLKNASPSAPLERRMDRLYNGYEYIGYDPRIKGDPFFEVKDWKPGSIQFDGRNFAAVPMLYDLVRDVVVVEHTVGFRMSLRSDKLNSFAFLNHRFIRLTDSTNRDIRTGFYDLLYDGPTQLLAKRTKVMLINSLANQQLGQFEGKVIYYIRKSGQYQPVKNRKTLLAVLTDRRQELTAYARTQKLRFRPDPESAIVTLTRYYDELGK